MKKKLTQHSLFQSLEYAISVIPDHRSLNHITHLMRDAIFVCFSGFFLQARSLKGHINFLKKSKANKNRKALFKISTIPTDNQVRNILDPISTSYFEQAQDDIIFKMQRSGVLKGFKKTLYGKEKSIEMGHLIGIDGFEYFRSECIHCDNCCQAHKKDDSIDYFHRALLGGLIHPTDNVFLPITQEFIVKQDGCEKEDCERKAAKRWLKKFREKHPHLPATILGDDAFCTQPYISELRDNRCGFVLSCQPGSHKTLFDWIDGLRQVGDLKVRKKKFRDGKDWYIATYEHANKVPLRDGEDAIYVNFVQVTIRTKDTDEFVGIHSYATDFVLTHDNCIEIASTGRRRWKSENEGNNTLTNNGYHLKHSFGHGKQNESHNFVLLNLIAFMIHVVLAFVNQEGYSALKEAMDTLYECFERIRNTFALIACSSWEQFYEIALNGLELDTS
ncbi:MAG: hypothetical protein H0U75_12750 [Legionella sp.]|nr:hypothetical protein [Legionella sp.]